MFAQEGVLHDSDLSKYVISLYWAFSTLCTVGYGDVVPNTTLERIFTIFAMLVGATVFAYFMGESQIYTEAHGRTRLQMLTKVGGSYEPLVSPT